jgi:hypothetical protein
VKYRFIRGYAEHWPVVYQRRLLGVQRSACYDWRVQQCKCLLPEELALKRLMIELSRGLPGTACETHVDEEPA